MAVELLGKYSKLENRNLPLNKVYIYANVGRLLAGGRTESKMDYVCLDDLLIYINDSQSRKVRDIKDFRSQLAKGNVYFKRFNADGIDLSRKVANDVELFVKDLDLPKSYLSTSINTERDSVDHGLLRELEVKAQDGFDGPYVYVGLIDNPNMQFIKKEDIGYYEAGKFISIKDKSIDEFKDKDLYTRHGNFFVTKMFTDATCSFEVIKQRETYDLEHMKKTTLVEGKDGSINAVEEDIDPYYSEQIMRPDGRDVTLEVMNYTVDPTADGEFILLRYLGEHVDTLVPINSLYSVNGDSIGDKIENFKENRNNLIGQSIFVKLANGSIFRTEPLTYEQVYKTYSKHETMQITEDESAILEDGTYLKLKDGRYVKENETVRPICYEFVSGDAFDAYMVKLDSPTADGKTSVIVDKSTFAKKAEVVVDGTTLKLENAFKIKETSKAMKDADVIQTTSGHNKIEQCVLLSEPKYNAAGEVETTPLSDEEKEKVIKRAKSQFESSYKEGDYELDRVVDDKGNLVELDKQKQRYRYTNVTKMKDYGNKDYALLRSGNIKYDASKGKLVGGPKFETAKYIKSTYKRIGTITTDAFSAMFSSWGILAALLLPQILVAGAVALAGAAVLNPIIFGIIGAIKNRNQNFKLKTNKHRKILKKEIIDDLEDVLKDTKTADKTNLTERNLLNKFETIDNKIMSLCATKRISSFRMVNGVGHVNRTNAALYTDFRKDMTAREKELKRLRKAVRKDPSLQATLDAKQSQYEQKIRDYVSQGVIEPKDKQMREMMDRSRKTKGFLLAKHFDQGEFTEEEKELIGAVDYNVRKNEFEYSSRKDKKKMKDKVKDLDKAMTEITKKDSFRTLADKKYNYEDSVISSCNTSDFEGVTAEQTAGQTAEQTAEQSTEQTAEHTAEQTAEREVARETELEHAENHEVTAEHTAGTASNTSTRRRTNTSTQAKTRLSEKNLVELMDNIRKLDQLNSQYLGSDEDMDQDLDDKIRRLEAKIRPSKHLLKKAAVNERYAKYKMQIIESEKLLKKYLVYRSSSDKIHVGRIDL